MSNSPAYQRFFAELKRRHIFRMVAVYGLVGFAVLQAVDLVVPALLLPEWTYRFVALFVFAGFPIALVITWAFEITPDGIRRTSAAGPGELEAIVAQPAARRWPAGFFALLGLALLVSGWWLGRRTAPDRAERPAVATDPSSQGLGLAMTDLAEDTRPSIAVLPFVDMSGDRDRGLAGLEGYVERYPFDSLGWVWIPELDPLRDDPRYVAVMRRMNLEGVEPQRTGGG